MMDLSGCPTQRFNFPESRVIFDKIIWYSDKLWRVLQEADRDNYIMCAGTPGVDIWTEGESPNQDFGIVSGHAYSIIAVKEYKKIRLLQVRNPWGRFEWGGKWSDNDTESWTREMIDAFQPEFDIYDGTFWISYNEFFNYFTSLAICKTRNWHELRIKGKFIKAVEDSKGQQDSVISQFFYSFTLEDKATVAIGLHQEDERTLGAERRPCLDVSYVIMRKNRGEQLEIVGVSDLVTDRD